MFVPKFEVHRTYVLCKSLISKLFTYNWIESDFFIIYTKMNV